MTHSRKAFAFESVKETENDSTFSVEKYRVLVPDNATKYDPTEHFMWFEESDFLGVALKGVPYATYKTDDPDLMHEMLQNGFADASGTVWRDFFSYWKDQEGHAFLVPESAHINSLAQLGVITTMKTPGDFMKVGKYVNRLFAALPKSSILHEACAWGKEVSWNEEEQIALILIDEDEKKLSEEERLLAIKYVDLKSLSAEQKALVDGCIIVSDKAVRVLGLSNNPQLGMAWRGTFGTERGLGKGHIMYKNDMSVDVVIYGHKTIVKTEKFYFGSMGPLHVGDPHTDRQACVNFHFHRNGLLLSLAKAFMRELMEASRDENRLRRLFLRHTGDLAHADMDAEAWILRRSLAFGVSYLRFPGLYRRVIRYMMNEVMSCYKKARIPMSSQSYSVAHYGYVLPDPNVIDSDGDIHPELGIAAGHIIFPDVEPGTKVICYRQPSETTNAWQALTVTFKPEYKCFAGRGICLLGQGADKVLGRLGGGDMDDQFVIVHDPKWVESFYTMREYPETEKVSGEPTDEEQQLMEEEYSELSEFTDELISDIRDRDMTSYTRKHVAWQIDMARNARAGIGPVVNYGMIDMLMSDPDHKASMLKDLRNHEEAWDWLDEREPYQAAFFMTNLEKVIDGNVKDQTIMKQLGDVAGTIKEFHKGCMVYPQSMVSRIPRTRREQLEKDGKLIVARSLLCHTLEMINDLQEKLRQIFTEREWALVTPADKELRIDYPFEREVSQRLRGEWARTEFGWERQDEETLSILDIWSRFWHEELSTPGKHEGAYKRICDVLSKELIAEDDNMMERLAVELYYQTYKNYAVNPKTDETTGQLRGFNDGLLWSPVFGNHFINAMRNARLTGFYKVAELEPKYRKRLMEVTVRVQARDHLLYIQDANDEFTKYVGFVIGKCPNGTFSMESGLVEIRQSAPICMADDIYVVPQKPLTRVIPSAKRPKKEDKEKLEGFGKLLSKALDVLGVK